MSGRLEKPTAGRYLYSAFFHESWASAPDRAAEIRTWLRSENASGHFEHDGAPVSGMNAAIRIDDLTRQQIDDFRSRFKPARDVLIPVLG